jgi:phosphatidate cytidylyltransferase
MLYIRILSAVIGAPLVIGAVYLGNPWYLILLLFVVNIGAYEYNYLLNNKGYSFSAIISFCGVSLFLIIVFFEQIELIYPLVMLLFFLFFVYALFKMDIMSISQSAVTLWGIIYIGGLCSYLLLLRMLPEGAIYTYILLIGVWLHDTLAYFVGIKWGLRKFAPKISPQKSVEGSMAGILGTMAVFLSVSILFPNLTPLRPGQALMLALGISVFAQLGDLLESALKRQLNVKDTGGIIPGHGGVLDRFDSLFLTAPFVYYFYLLMEML